MFIDKKKTKVYEHIIIFSYTQTDSLLQILLFDNTTWCIAFHQVSLLKLSLNIQGE